MSFLSTIKNKGWLDIIPLCLYDKKSGLIMHSLDINCFSTTPSGEEAMEWFKQGPTYILKTDPYVITSYVTWCLYVVNILNIDKLLDYYILYNQFDYW